MYYSFLLSVDECRHEGEISTVMSGIVIITHDNENQEIRYVRYRDAERTDVSNV